MKAQLAIDYFISLLIFATTVSYMGFQLLSAMPSYRNEIKAETLRSEAYQISEMLINDPGDPPNWNQTMVSNGLINRTGLSNETEKTNLLSVTKISLFDASCEGNGYENISKWIGIDPDKRDSHQFNITLFSIEDEKLKFWIVCSPALVRARATVASIERTVAFDNGKHGEFWVRVW